MAEVDVGDRERDSRYLCSDGVIGGVISRARGQRRCFQTLEGILGRTEHFRLRRLRDREE